MRYTKVRDNRDVLVIMGVLLVLCFDKWKIWSPQNDELIGFLQHTPNRYRLWTQFLIMLDQHPLGYIALVSIVFAVASWYLCLGCRKEDRMMMFAWLTFTISGGSVRQAPAFVLLALAILLRDQRWSYLMVIPMTLVKEHAGLVYIIYLFSIKRYREAVGVGTLWAVTFLSVRLLIGPLDLWVSPSFLTLETYILKLGNLSYWLRWASIVAEIMLCIVFLRDRIEVFMVAANLPIITVFGLFYEPQL